MIELGRLERRDQERTQLAAYATRQRRDDESAAAVTRVGGSRAEGAAGPLLLAVSNPEGAPGAPDGVAAPIPAPAPDRSDPVPLPDPGSQILDRARSAPRSRRAPRAAPDTDRWREWLADPGIADRYRAKVWRPSDPELAARVCWPWIGAVSDTGHGKFRVVSSRVSEGLGVVSAHVFGYQLEKGVILRRGIDPAHDLVVRHSCDEHGCQNSITHMSLGTSAENGADFQRRQMYGPLADVRGPAGRTRAIADAVREGLVLGESDLQILDRVAAARSAGEPQTLF